MSDRLETAKQLKLPRALIDAGATYENEAERIRRQEFKPAKEAEQIANLEDGFRQTLRSWQEQEVETIAAEREAELKTLDAEIAREGEFKPPSRGLTDSDSEYNVQLSRAATLHSAAEARKLRAATLAATDVGLIAQMSNPAQIRALVDDAIAGGDAAAIVRVGAAADLRLERLAKIEAARVGSGNVGADRPVGTAWTALKVQLDGWRAEQDGRSPEARRDRVRRAHAARIDEIRRHAEHAARLFRRRDPVVNVDQTTAIEQSRAAQAASK